MSEAGLQQRMSRQMAVSQAMRTGMRILQASSMELGQMIRQALESNPMLEEAPDSSPEGLEDESIGGDDLAREDGWSEFTARGKASPEAAARRDFLYESIVAPESLKSHLMAQAEHSSLEGRPREALLLLIDALDERGFLTESPSALEERECFSARDMKIALHTLREMDPPGVGAADLRESLLLQLARRGQKSSAAFQLVSQCWRELAAHKYDEAAQKLELEPEVVAAALESIRRLTPNPGNAFAPGGNPYILPDVVVEGLPDGTWNVSLTSEYLPRLAMNEDYMEMMSEAANDRELRQYLRKAYRDGQELLRALNARQETVLKLARFIVRKQEGFFKSGPAALKVMGMEEAADEMGVHISTVSRACRDKYLLCRWGMKELRSFFSSGVSASFAESGDSSVSGEATAAAEAVQAVMRRLIAEEDPSHPLSDAKLSEALKQRGISVARRTVAKYREQMKILPASLRRGV